MLRSKLYELFVTLPSAARRDLRLWVKSPFVNTRQDVVDLYNYLDTTSPRDFDLFHKERVFKAIFKEKNYIDTKMRYTMSFLLKVLEQYLAYQQVVVEPLLQDWYLANAYRNLILEKPYTACIERVSKQLEQGEQGADTLRRQYEVEKLNFAFLIERKRLADSNLQTVLDRLDQFYAAEKLKMVCSALSQQTLFKADLDYGLIDPILTQVTVRGWVQTVPIIGAFYYTYRLATETEGIPYFHLLKGQIMSMQHTFAPEEQRTLYLFAINFAIKQVNLGDTTFFRELFELYQQGIEKDGILLENEELSPFTYKNLVAIGLRLGEFEYVEAFINEYTAKLPVEQRKNYHEYCRARLFFALKRYKDAMPILVQLNYGDIYLQLDANVMLVKMYYELGEFDVLSSLLDSFKQLINRKKSIVGYHQDNYQNIIRFTNRLMHLNIHNAKAVARFREELKNATPLTERGWLLEQL
jgi:hypothetical protein